MKKLERVKVIDAESKLIFLIQNEDEKNWIKEFNTLIIMAKIKLPTVPITLEFLIFCEASQNHP